MEEAMKDGRQVLEDRFLTATAQGHAVSMTSLEIAEITGKKHFHVMRDIRNLIEQGVNQLNFEPAKYSDPKGEKRLYYRLTPKGCLILASGYNVLLREKIIDRLEELEKGKPASYEEEDRIKRAQLWIEEEKERRRLLLENQQQAQQISEQCETIEQQGTEIRQLSDKIEEMRPKVDYLDRITESDGSVPVSLIAQDYGMTANRFNQLLKKLGVQNYRGGTWTLTRNYVDKPYVVSHLYAFDKEKGPSGGCRMHTRWTRKGWVFLYEFLKKKGILPVTEQNQDGQLDLFAEAQQDVSYSIS